MERSGTPYSEVVRQTIRTTLARLGCDVDEALRESILIRQGVYCGRRFECEGGYAVWFIEENQLKYYGSDGALICVAATPGADADVAPSRELLQPRRRAA